MAMKKRLLLFLLLFLLLLASVSLLFSSLLLVSHHPPSIRSDNAAVNYMNTVNIGDSDDENGHFLLADYIVKEFVPQRKVFYHRVGDDRNGNGNEIENVLDGIGEVIYINVKESIERNRNTRNLLWNVFGERDSDGGVKKKKKKKKKKNITRLDAVNKTLILKEPYSFLWKKRGYNYPFLFKSHQNDHNDDNDELELLSSWYGVVACYSSHIEALLYIRQAYIRSNYTSPYYLVTEDDLVFPVDDDDDGNGNGNGNGNYKIIKLLKSSEFYENIKTLPTTPTEWMFIRPILHWYQQKWFRYIFRISKPYNKSNAVNSIFYRSCLSTPQFLWSFSSPYSRSLFTIYNAKMIDKLLIELSQDGIMHIDRLMSFNCGGYYFLPHGSISPDAKMTSDREDPNVIGKLFKRIINSKR